MDNQTASLKKTARFAGLLYLIFTIPGAYGLVYVPSQIMVDGNAAATVKNLLAHEFLFRTGIVSQLFCYCLFIYLVLVLHRLLKQAGEYPAKLMVALVLVQSTLGFFIETFNFTALMIAKGQVLSNFSALQRQDMVMLFLKMHTYSLIALEIFWGFWLLPFGQVVYRSGFIPKVFGVLLTLAGISYITESLTYFLFPAYHQTVAHYAGWFCSVGEFSIVLWLLIMGARVPKVK